MINDVLNSNIKYVNSFGNGNYIFKAFNRSYNFNIPKQSLMRFIQKDGFSMTEEWFDRIESLSNEDFENLKRKLCI